MKKWYALWIVLGILLLMTVTGCQRTYDFSFAQSMDHVEKVEICQYDYNSHAITTIAVLSKADADSLLAEIDALECRRYFGDGLTDYGEVVVYITYADQTGEVVGPDNVAKVDKDGNWHIGVEYFDTKRFYTVIMKYVDSELLPDLSFYFD